MALAQGINVLKALRYSTPRTAILATSKVCMSTRTPAGSYLPEPQKPRFVFLRIIACVGAGLFIGSTLSKNIASFLEENDLFVPADDDDDD